MTGAREAAPPTRRESAGLPEHAHSSWADSISVDVHLGSGDWLWLLRANGFEVEDFIEVRPPERADSNWPLTTLEGRRVR